MHSEFGTKVSEMSDLALARGIIDETFDLGRTPRAVVIGLAIAALKRVERGLPDQVLRDRQRTWTERRVRSIVDEEARRIEHYEIEDLNRMKLAEARVEFKRSTERQARLAALLAHQDADFHSDEIHRLGQLGRGMDRSGDRGE